MRKRTMISILILSMASMLAFSNPVFSDPSQPVPASPALRLLTINVWSGLDYKGSLRFGSYESRQKRQARYRSLLVQIRELNPDVIFLQEVNPAAGFPAKITYRRGSEGWLYAAVEGKIDGADRQVTYPMRRIDCESGEFIRK